MDKKKIFEILCGALLSIAMVVGNKKNKNTVGDIPMMIVIATIIVCIAICVWNI